MSQKELELAIMLIFFIVSGCYYGWRTFIQLVSDGEVSRWDAFMSVFCYGFAIACSVRMGGYFAF